MPQATYGKSEKTVVSVITPCYNGAPFLRRWARSLLSQTFPEIQAILVNDGSTDDTPLIVKHELAPLFESRFPLGLTYLDRSNGGPCAAINTALSVASGKWILFLDVDDELTPQAIESLVKVAADSTEPELVFGRYIIVDEAGCRTEGPNLSPVPGGRQVFEALVRFGMFIKAGTYLFRRDCLHYLPGGRLNERYWGQNWELLLRVSFRGRVAYCPHVCAIIHSHPASRSRGLSPYLLSERVERSLLIWREVLTDLNCWDTYRDLVTARYLADQLEAYRITRQYGKLLWVLLTSTFSGRELRRAATVYVRKVIGKKVKAFAGKLMFTS